MRRYGSIIEKKRYFEKRKKIFNQISDLPGAIDFWYGRFTNVRRSDSRSLFSLLKVLVVVTYTSEPQKYHHAHVRKHLLEARGDALHQVSTNNGFGSLLDLPKRTSDATKSD